jgi:hypothetical protein
VCLAKRWGLAERPGRGGCGKSTAPEKACVCGKGTGFPTRNKAREGAHTMRTQGGLGPSLGIDLWFVALGIGRLPALAPGNRLLYLQLPRDGSHCPAWPLALGARRLVVLLRYPVCACCAASIFNASIPAVNTGQPWAMGHANEKVAPHWPPSRGVRGPATCSGVWGVREFEVRHLRTRTCCWSWLVFLGFDSMALGQIELGHIGRPSCSGCCSW